jgi:GR25 family glycosyltransferase involved in LPS biosynthesis
MFNNIPKFVINLDRRKDRLQSIVNEMSYMGWEFERFSAIDTNSHNGCARSHQEICKMVLERNYEYAMIFEDDIIFMPYAKDLLVDIYKELFENNLDWKFFHLGPCIHRPINKYNNNLLDLSNLPDMDPNQHRGIYCTNAYIVTPQACEYIVEWDSNKYIYNSNQQITIDQYFDMIIYPSLPSFTAKWPITVQQYNYSDINHTLDNNYYLMTYNWNLYCPDKLTNQFLKQDECLNLRK